LLRKQPTAGKRQVVFLVEDSKLVLALLVGQLAR